MSLPCPPQKEGEGFFLKDYYSCLFKINKVSKVTKVHKGYKGYKVCRDIKDNRGNNTQSVNNGRKGTYFF